MENFEIFGVPSLKKGSGIHIKKENRGKFTDYCGGKVTQECIDKAKKSKNPKLRKRATFAENARKWKHEEGAKIHKPNGHRSILDNGWFSTKDLKKPKLIKRHKNGSTKEGLSKSDYSKTQRVSDDKDVSKWRRAVYSTFDPSWGYPNIFGAVVNGGASVIKALFNSDKMLYDVKDKAGDNYWRYKLGLSVDPEHFGEVLDDGSVTLPKYVENEIPTDTTMLKNRIAADEQYLKDGMFTQEQWDIAKGLVNTDKETLEALRRTYKTGEPVVINEYSYNSRPLLKEGKYTSTDPTPLNMLQNFTVQHIPYDKAMRYYDVYDHNQYEWAVPGEPYIINGSISQKKKYQFGGKTKFHQNWLNQRIPLLAKNANMSEEEAQKIANKQIEDLKNTPEYIYGTPKYYKNLSIEDQYNTENILNDGAFALYNIPGKFIVYQDQFEKDLAKTHERTHAMNPIEQELAITKYKNEKRNIFANSKQKYDPYLDSSAEVYARLMDAREKYKLDPNKKYSKEDLQKLKEKIKKDWGIDDTVIFDRYNDDYILHLLNDIAQNNSPKYFDDNLYA